MADGRRVEIIPENDSRFILLRIDRVMLAALLLVLALTVFVMAWTSLNNARNDNELTRIVNNANEVSEASVDFWRCAFLIEPDVKKTPPVVQTCIDQARFPQHVKEGR